MDFLDALARLATLDTTNTAEVLAPRRLALSRLGQAGTALLPALFTTLVTPAEAGTTQTLTRLDALKLALKLENLQNAFYSRALGLTAGGPANPTVFFGSTAVQTAIQTIQTHQSQHSTLLTTLITNSGGALDAASRYDFSGSKNGSQAALYPDVYTNLDTFLKVAQLLEDAGVRVYKGQVTALQSDNALLEAAIRMHSTEARHAAHIRTLRRQRGAVVKSWVSPSDTAITTAGTTADGVYSGEANTLQYITSNTTVTKVPFDSTLPINVGTPALSAAAILAKVAEAFDEPLEAQAAESVLQLFTY
ncbi:ferritin-like domain-containing protein [Hymenobacter endophyticus]|uniref:Ferritin-like domain-containing protein n=1 Tax=Hymenobacter endophyticus TaxID=3076335 RepID=A0ABU3TCZ6_9BACT|nr:ferritin-like domain-containing protein [Hymenobacter endophyticus]MDU0369246.1 ferritin-like domain-containing protein [Hymenobacter endophyticus]